MSLPDSLELIKVQSLKSLHLLLSELCKAPEFNHIKALISQIPSIKKALDDGLSQAFHNVLTQEPCHARIGIIGEVQQQIGELTLLDNEELSFRLACEGFIDKAQVLGGINLALLTMRFEYVTDKQLGDEDLPLGPQQLVSILQRAVQPIKLEAEVKLAFFKAYINAIYKRYNLFLNNANNIFIDKGVCDQLDESDGRARFRRKRDKVKAAQKRSSLLTSISQNIELDDEGNPLPPRMDELLKQIHIPESAVEHVLEANIMAPDATGLELLSAINELKRSPLASNGEYQQQQSHQSLAKQLQQSTSLADYCIDKSNANSISMMSLLFEDLYNNEHIAAPIMALFEQLQVPLLKTAVLDKNFFADSGNPAQVLLDIIAEQGVSWTPDKDPENDYLYQQMLGIVNEVNQKFDGSYAVFNSAINEFHRSLKINQQRTARIEARIVSAEKARARVDRAKQEANRHIEISFDIYDLPDALAVFLQKQWKAVLFYIHNKYDNQQNDEWRKALMAEKLLQQNLNGHEKAVKNKALAAMQQSMLATGMEKIDVNRALKTIVDSVAKVAKKADRIESKEQVDIASVADYDGQSNNEVSEMDLLMEAGVVGDECDPDVLDASDVSARLSDEQIVQLQNQLTVGSWLIDYSAVEPEKVKIAAYIKHTDTYILVHRNGSKSGSFDSYAIIKLLRQKQLKLLESSLVFDKALESVISAIREA